MNRREVGDCICIANGGPLDDAAELSIYMSDGVPETVWGATVIEVEEDGSSRKNESLGLRELEVLGADDRPA